MRRALISLLLLGMVGTWGCVADEARIAVRPTFQSEALTSTSAVVVPKDVVTLRVTVRVGGASAVTSREQVKDSGTIVVGGIAPGTGREILLEGLDGADNVLYSGSDTVDLQAGETTEVVIELSQPFTSPDGSGLPSLQVRSGVGSNPAIVNSTQLELGLLVAGAQTAIIANDQSMGRGRVEYDLASLPTDGDAYVISDWDLQNGFDNNIVDGTRFIYAQFKSADNVNSAIYSVPVELDQRAPDVPTLPLFERCDGRSQARRAPNELWVAKDFYGCSYPTSIDALTPTIRITFAVDELVDPATQVRVYIDDGGSGITIPVDPNQSSGNFIVAYYEITGLEPESGSPPLPNVLADVTDHAGNNSVIPLGTLAFDFTPPAEPDVTSPGCILYVRRPWGDQANPTASYYWLAKESSCVSDIAETGAELVAYDGPDPLLANEIGRTAASGFTKLNLNRVDRSLVYVVAEDPAGNMSDSDLLTTGPQATLVKQVRWVASMNRKDLDDPVQNPNDFVTREVLGSTLEPLDGATPVTLQTPATTHGRGRWRQQNPSIGLPTFPAGYPTDAFAFDPDNGVVVFVGKQGSTTLEWGNRVLKEVCGGASGCSQHQLNTIVGAAYSIPLRSVVAVGGSAALATWAWNGDRWYQVCAEGACNLPTYSSSQFLGADFSTGDVMLYNGTGAKSYVLRGDSWQPMCTGCSEPTLDGGTLVYDSDQQRLSLVGADTAAGAVQIWERQSDGWLKLCGSGTACTVPAELTGIGTAFSAGFDEERKTVVIVTSANTFEYTGGALTLASSSGGAGRLVYDTRRLGLYLVSPGLSPTVRRWSGTGWQSVCMTGSSCALGAGFPGAWSSMAYVPVQNAVLNLDNTGSAVLSKWTGDSWSVLPVDPFTMQNDGDPATEMPSDRPGATITASPSGVVLFGGMTDEGTTPVTCPDGSMSQPVGATQWCPTNEVYVYNNKIWTLVSLSSVGGPPPSGRIGAQVVPGSPPYIFVIGGITDVVSGTNTPEVWRVPVNPNGPWALVCSNVIPPPPPGTPSCPSTLVDAAAGVDPANLGQLIGFDGTDIDTVTTAAVATSLCPLGADCSGSIATGAREVLWNTVTDRPMYFDGSDLLELEDSGWQTLCAGAACPHPPARRAPLTALDPNREEVIVAGGLSLATSVCQGSTGPDTPCADAWSWELGRGLRPGHVFEVEFGAAHAAISPADCSAPTATCPIRAVTATWYAGGSAPGASDGVELYTWRGRWTATNAINAETSTSAATGSPLTWQQTDSAALASMFSGDNQRIALAVTPRGPNGAGQAEIASDYVEVAVDYLIP